MQSSPKHLNILASVTGLMLTAGVVFISASSDAPDVSAGQIAVVAPAPTTFVPATEPVASTAPASAPPDTSGTASSKPATPVSTPAPVTTPVATPAPVQHTNTSGYADGTYKATTNYRTPGSIESVAVTLSLSHGVVSGVSISQSAADHDSRRYQAAFASSYQQYVVGKSITSLNLSRVSGASLTSEAFDNALSQIRAEAKA